MCLYWAMSDTFAGSGLGLGASASAAALLATSKATSDRCAYRRRHRGCRVAQQWSGCSQWPAALQYHARKGVSQIVLGLDFELNDSATLGQMANDVNAAAEAEP